MDAWNFSHLVIRKVVFQPSVFWWILAVTFREGQISGTELASPKTSLFCWLNDGSFLERHMLTPPGKTLPLTRQDTRMLQEMSRFVSRLYLHYVI